MAHAVVDADPSAPSNCPGKGLAGRPTSDKRNLDAVESIKDRFEGTRIREVRYYRGTWKMRAVSFDREFVAIDPEENVETGSLQTEA
jgi:hypothetical protein